MQLRALFITNIFLIIIVLHSGLVNGELNVVFDRSELSWKYNSYFNPIRIVTWAWTTLFPEFDPVCKEKSAPNVIKWAWSTLFRNSDSGSVGINATDVHNKRVKLCKEVKKAMESKNNVYKNLPILEHMTRTDPCRTVSMKYGEPQKTVTQRMFACSSRVTSPVFYVFYGFESKAAFVCLSDVPTSDSAVEDCVLSAYVTGLGSTKDEDLLNV